MQQQKTRGSIDFDGIAAAARPRLREIVERWLPGGVYRGAEYLVRNPKRADRSPGSFSINIRTGKFADFADGTGGHDAIALAAFLFDIPQAEAARRIAAMLGLPEPQGPRRNG